VKISINIKAPPSPTGLMSLYSISAGEIIRVQAGAIRFVPAHDAHRVPSIDTLPIVKRKDEVAYRLLDK
jgi:hypothetical protein